MIAGNLQPLSPTSAELVLPPASGLRQKFSREAFVICPGALTPEGAGELREKALDLVRQHARRIDQRSEEHVLRYRVVTGEVVQAEWPQLFALYDSPGLRAWVAAVGGLAATYTSSHLQSAININALGEPSDIYRWHFDAAGLTLLLYLSDSSTEDGGELEMRTNDYVQTMLPTAGTVVLMDGTRCMHRVSPILRHHKRISIPMVFTADANHERPASLDDYLYSQRSR
jgi:hypothetical protein